MRASRSGESALLLLDVVHALAAGGADYAVVGALAASVHGVVRASLDADAVLSTDVREAGRVQRLLEAAGFQVELHRGDAGDPIAAMLRVGDLHGNRVDLLLGLRGMPAELFSRTIEIPFQGSRLKFAGLEDFIAMKAFAGGPVDLLDASHALGAGQKVDEQLLRGIAAHYGRAALATVDSLLAGARGAT